MKVLRFEPSDKTALHTGIREFVEELFNLKLDLKSLDTLVENLIINEHLINNLTNQFIKQHSKDNNKVNKHSLKIKIPRPNKDISGQILRGKPVYEEIKRIQNLIIYESKI